MGRKWWKKQQKQKQQPAKVKPVSQVTKVTPAVYTPPCHDGVLGVFKYDNVVFWGGKARDMMQFNDWHLMLCFSDRNSQWESNEPSTFITCNSAGRQLLSPSLFIPKRDAPFIGIDWPDYGVPDLGVEWWETLVGDILRLEGDPVNVVMGCTGGHGRTGTALAILLGLLYPDETECPVEHIRKVYCDRVVESRVQIDYIAAMTGIGIKAKPCWARNTTANKNSGYWSQYEVGTRAEGDDLDEKHQGSSGFHDLQTAAALEAKHDRDLELIVQKELGIAPTPDYIYKPITNHAGDIIGWEPRKDVGI